MLLGCMFDMCGVVAALLHAETGHIVDVDVDISLVHSDLIWEARLANASSLSICRGLKHTFVAKNGSHFLER